MRPGNWWLVAQPWIPSRRVCATTRIRMYCQESLWSLLTHLSGTFCVERFHWSMNRKKINWVLFVVHSSGLSFDKPRATHRQHGIDPMSPHPLDWHQQWSNPFRFCSDDRPARCPSYCYYDWFSVALRSQSVHTAFWFSLFEDEWN